MWVAVACGALTLASMASAAAQSAVLGTLDPATGAITPAATAPTPSAPVQLGGTFVLKGTVAIGSNIVSDTTLTAFAQISAQDTTYSNYSSIPGKLSRSGSQGTITLRIPYLWTMISANEQVTISLAVFANTSTINYTFSKTVTMTMPKNGSTTTIDISGAL